MIADFWYTAWVDAGQPEISKLLDDVKVIPDSIAIQKETTEWQKESVEPSRVHEH